jgi:hypothetical protein
VAGLMLKPLFVDPFTGYSSQTEFENAYPYDPPSDMSPSLVYNPLNHAAPYIVWGLTRGPGGVPGLENVTKDPAFLALYDPFGHGPFGPSIDKVGLAPQCRLFRVSTTSDFAGHVPTEPLNNSNELLAVWSYETGNR